jgi:hypothetical protein
MSIRASLLALASIAALATAALATTNASAFADGSVRFHKFADHAHSVFFAKRSGGGGYLPPCGRVGCNMKQ